MGEFGTEYAQIKSYRDLAVWQQAMNIAEHCYGLTESFPKSELYGMTSQIRRASVSVAANIAEGHGRETTGLFIHALRLAQGSLKELETHLILAGRVQLAKQSDVDPVIERCDGLGRMLRALTRSLQKREER